VPVGDGNFMHSCPRDCHGETQHKLVQGEHLDTYVVDLNDSCKVHKHYRSYIYICMVCSKHTYFYVFWSTQHQNRDPNAGWKFADEDFQKQIIHQYPTSTTSTHPSLDDQASVRTAYIEAEKCLSVQAYNACGTMCRRAVDAICLDLLNAEDKEGTDGVADRLSKLKKRLPQDMIEWGFDLKILGDMGAHPELREVTSDDAIYGVEFLKQLVQFAYISPYERKLRAPKKGSKENPQHQSKS